MSAPSQNTLRRYFYDPLDHLMGAGLTQATNAQRFYQDERVTTELDQDRQTTIFRHQAQPLAHKQTSVSMTDTALLLTDLAHSVLHKSSSSDSREFAFTVYGGQRRDGGLLQLLGFNGESADDITGHYSLGQGHRFYNPILMRFNSPDQQSPFGEGGCNPYAYCKGDPINFIDPSGNVPTTAANPYQPWNYLTNVKQRAGVDLRVAASRRRNGIILNRPGAKRRYVYPGDTVEIFRGELGVTYRTNSNSRQYVSKTVSANLEMSRDLNKTAEMVDDLIFNGQITIYTTDRMQKQFDNVTRIIESQDASSRDPKDNRLLQQQLRHVETIIKNFSYEILVGNIRLSRLLGGPHCRRPL